MRATTPTALAALFLLVQPAAAFRYRIDTFAGGGTQDGRSVVGDGEPATRAVLSHPTGLARDHRGNVYVADHDGSRVRRVTTRRGVRTITTIAGTGEKGFGGDEGPAADARFVLPTGLAFLPSGDLLVVDAGDDAEANCVRRIDAAGVVHAFAGRGDLPPGNTGNGGPAVAARLHTPLRAAVAPNGDVFVVELNNNQVRVVHPDGTIAPFAGTGDAGSAGDEGPADAAQLRNPAGLALDRDGSLFIADFGNDRIRAVTPDGIIHAVAGTGVQTHSIDGEGGDPHDDSGDGGAASGATFWKPTGIVFDPRGALLVADQGNSVVRRIAPGPDGRVGPDSSVATIIGDGAPAFAGDGGDALLASLLIPTDVLPIGHGRLLVADRGNGRVRIAVPVRKLCAKSCSDGDPCTTDHCTQTTGCTHEASGRASCAP